MNNTYQYDRPLSYLLVDLTRFLQEARQRLPVLLSYDYVMPLKDVVAIVLSISINKTVSVGLLHQSGTPDDSFDLLWSILEDKLGTEHFNHLDMLSVEKEAVSLLENLEMYLSTYLPPSWRCGEYTFFEWKGETIVLLKDG